MEVRIAETRDIEGRGPTESVDRLLGVANDPEIPSVGSQGFQKPDTASVHVLELVHQHVLIGGRKMPSHLRIVLAKPDRHRDKVAEVDATVVLFDPLIG